MESGEGRRQLNLQAANGRPVRYVKNVFQTGSERFLTWQLDKPGV